MKLESEISLTIKQKEIKCPSAFIKMFHSVGILLFCNIILINPTIISLVQCWKTFHNTYFQFPAVSDLGLILLMTKNS